MKYTGGRRHMCFDGSPGWSGSNKLSVLHLHASLWLILCDSCTDLVDADLKRSLLSIISVSSHEVLKQKFRIGEITGIILERLPVASNESLLEVGTVPDPPLHVLTFKEWLSFPDEFISTHLHILVEKIASQDLLSVFSIQYLRVDKGISEDGLCDE